MRFTAPPHVASVDLACGSFAVVDGAINVPDDLGPGDMAGLAVNGFVRANDTPAAAKSQAAKATPPAEPVAPVEDAAIEPSKPVADESKG